MKVLSIVIPTYNVEKYLKRCLDSLVYDESILDDIEIIVVNDGGKDNSLAIAKEYEKEYSNCIIVIDKENGGHGSTINAGLKVATGKYFRVIDSDDWVNIDDFSNYVKDLKKLDVDLVITDYTKELIYSGDIQIYKYPEEIEYNKKYSLKNFDLSNLKDEYFYMATSTYKTSVLREAKVKLDEKTFYVDMEYNIFPIKYVNDFVRLNYNIYRYYIGRADQSVTINSLIRNRKHHELVLTKLLDFYKNTKLDDNKKKYVRKIIVQMCNTHYTIYCKAKLPKKKDIKELKNLDKKIKLENPEIYEEISRNYDYIRWNRRTNFMFAQSYKNIFSRLADRRRGDK